MLYSCYMMSPQELWFNWAEMLHKKELTTLVAWWLEAAGPLNFFGAQLLLIGQPFLPETRQNQVQALVEILENHEKSHLFVSYLRGFNP